MATTRLDLYSISQRIGYTHYLTFVAAYQRQKNTRPSDVPRLHLPAPIDALTSLRAGRGLLGEKALLRYVENLRQICPAVANRIHIGPPSDPEPLMIADGARDDRLDAEDLWRRIRDLPFAEQCRVVRRHLCRSEAVFDLLREKSRLEGRKSRQRGIEVAKLALVSLERSDEIFGERIYELRAFGHAWLANAFVLALDFSAASSAFEQADREWATPRAEQDLSVLAHICCLKGVLRMMRQEYSAATRDLDRSCSLFRQLGHAPDEALALIHRSMIHGYAGRLDKAVADLREASGLIDGEDKQELAFAIHANLANVFVRDGQAGAATKELALAWELNRGIDDPLGAIKLAWIEGDLRLMNGDLKHAKRFYQRARSGFLDLSERGYSAIVSVDLMVVHSMQDDWETVGAMAAETLPILSSLTLHSETVATVKFLVQATEAGSVSHRLLNGLQNALRHDPLAS